MKGTDLVQGTLDLLILKVIALEPCTGGRSRSASGRSRRNRCRFSRARSTRHSTASNCKAGSRRNGSPPTTDAAPSITRSRSPAARNWRTNGRSGSVSRPASLWCSRRVDDAHAHPTPRPPRHDPSPPTGRQPNSKRNSIITSIARSERNLAAGMSPARGPRRRSAIARRRRATTGGMPRRPRDAAGSTR